MLKKSCLLLLFFAMQLAAEETASLMRLDLSQLSPKDVQQLRALNLDVASVDVKHGRLDAILLPEQKEVLQSKGVLLQPLITDINAYADRLRASNYFDYFYDYPQMVAEMQEIVAAHPQIASMHDIGDSYLKLAGRDGFDVWALKISDDVFKEDSTEADILYMANMHAREIITPEVLLYFIHHLIDNYGRDAMATHLVNNRELWFIPCLNPDGRQYVAEGNVENRNNFSWLEPLWWRKNMRDNNVDSIFDPLIDGVDLNRNFGFAWGLDEVGSSSKKGDFDYRGPAAFSEPETQIVRDFVQSKPIIVSLSYHSYSNLWLFPWGYTKEPLPGDDGAVFKALADSCVFYNGYNAQAGVDLYPVNGDSDDWLYGECGIWAFTPEVGDGDIDGFFPDTTRILSLVEENLGANIYMAWAAGEEPIVEYKKLADRLTQQNYFDLEVEINHPIVLTDSIALDSTSFRVCYRVEDELDFSVAPIVRSDSLDALVAKIPGDKIHGKVYYYAEALDSLGRRGTWPRGAPLAMDSIQVDFPVSVQQSLAPYGFQLMQNYPNPCNLSTKIPIVVPEPVRLRLNIYDLNGRLVRELTDRNLAAGDHIIFWDGKDNAGDSVASGCYFCRVRGRQFEKSIKILMLR